MAVPKRRTSRTKRDSRRANHDRVSAPALAPCPKCGESRKPHHVCPSCGHYGEAHEARGPAEAPAKPTAG